MNNKNTKRLLELLSDGKAHTFDSIHAKLGLTSKQVESALTCCRISGAVLSIPVRYKITAKGKERAASTPMTHEQKLAKAKEVRRLQREARDRVNAELVARIEQRRLMAAAEGRGGRPRNHARVMPALSVIRSALESRPALDMAWMSIARTQEASHV